MSEIKIDGVNFALSDKMGALVIYCAKHFRGVSICVEYPITEEQVQQSWANVVEKTVNNKQEFVAVFPSLQPGYYRVNAVGGKPQQWVTIFANHIAEVDYR